MIKTFLAFGANFISSWIRIRIQETNLMRIPIRIRNTAPRIIVRVNVSIRLDIFWGESLPRSVQHSISPHLKPAP
jgi:hypothetical protein